MAAFDEHRDNLERLAVQTYTDLMTDSTVDPAVRKASADSIMRALGKDAPPKAANTLVMNFGTGLTHALTGMGQLSSLLLRNSEEEEARDVTPSEVERPGVVTRGRRPGVVDAELVAGDRRSPA